MKLVKARAYLTDEDFGYDRWKADTFSLGRGTHDALILILDPSESPDELLDRLYNIGIRLSTHTEALT